MRKRRAYQKEAVEYAMKAVHPAFFVQMRLGKTLMTIDACNRWKAKRILVVAPTSALFSWEDELKLEKEKKYVYLTDRSTRAALLEESSSRWFLMNKDAHLTFRTVTEGPSGRKQEWWDTLFTEYPWDAVVLDESTFIRRPKSSVSKCFTRHFQDVPHRVIMSGLPNPEGLMDFFQQFLFLDGGETFGTNYWEFQWKHFRKDFYMWTPRAHTYDKITNGVRERAFTLRRKDVRLDVPVVYEKRCAILPPALRRTYDKAEKEFVLEYGDKKLDSTVYKITVYSWLRHIASGFLEGRMKWAGKVDLLIELLKGELRGEPMVVWFDLNEGLFACRRWLLAAGYTLRTVVGAPAMSMVRRKLSLSDWKAGRAQILLAQVRCLQYGVDLSRADTQIFFTSPLSGEHRAQAVDRLVRVGGKGILCIDLVTRDTVDEDIYKLLQKKRRNAVRLLDACSMITRRRIERRQ